MLAVDSFSFGARRSRVAGADRQGLDRRAAVHEHVQLSRTGIFHRWHQRRQGRRAPTTGASSCRRPRMIDWPRRSKRSPSSCGSSDAPLAPRRPPDLSPAGRSARPREGPRRRSIARSGQPRAASRAAAWRPACSRPPAPARASRRRCRTDGIVRVNSILPCSRTRAGWRSSTVFAHELPPRSAGFDAENRLYLSADDRDHIRSFLNEIEAELTNWTLSGRAETTNSGISALHN
jgi:hypothetical protein